MSSYVRYIDKTRDYYRGKGYANDYRWAHFDDVPFTALQKSLSECRVALISTSDISARDVEKDLGDGMAVNNGGVYSLPSELPVDRLYSHSHSYDRVATTLDDVDSFYPTTHLHDAVRAGRIGSLARRFHGLYNAYSQRVTRERDAVELVRRCKEDGVDVALLAPVCPVCHQTVSLASRALEEAGIATVVFCTARDIVEYCGVARLVHCDYPLGNPCGEPFDAAQQKEILEIGFKLLERAFVPRTAIQSPFAWSKGDKWKDLIFTDEQPFQTQEVEEKWKERKDAYKALKAAGKV